MECFLSLQTGVLHYEACVLCIATGPVKRSSPKEDWATRQHLDVLDVAKEATASNLFSMQINRLALNVVILKPGG